MGDHETSRQTFVIKYQGDKDCYPSHYIGISGGFTGSGSGNHIAPLERLLYAQAGGSDWGYASCNGPIAFGTKNMAAVTDGTSNTFCFSEMSRERETNESTPTASVYRSWVRGGFYVDSSTGSSGQILLLTSKSLRDQDKHQINDADRYSTDTTIHFIGARNDAAVHSRHPGGANFALLDGSVRFVPMTIRASVYVRFGCGNDGEAVSLP